MNRMKLFTTALTAALLLTGCSGNDTSVSSDGGAASSNIADGSAESAIAATAAERTAELLTAVEFPGMAEVTEDRLAVYYNIDPAAVTEFSAYVAGAGAYPDEFGIFVAVDETTAASIENALNERIEKQKNTYADYSPDEMYKFDESFVKVDGSTVYFAVCADGATAADILG